MTHVVNKGRSKFRDTIWPIIIIIESVPSMFENEKKQYC